MRCFGFGVVGLALLGVVAMSSARPLGKYRTGQQEPLRVDVRLVNVQATVTDSAGRYVGDLRAEDFTLEEDGVPQKIVHFSQDRDMPVSVGILFDTSVSMERKLRTATDALDRFLRSIHKEDDAFLTGFSRRVNLLQDFTNDREKLARKLQTIDLALGTVFYDAVMDGLKKIRTGSHDKKALLVITDGVDSGSSTTRDQMLTAVRDAETLIYALGTGAETYADRTDHVPFNLPSSNGGIPPLSSIPAGVGGRSGGRAGGRGGGLNQAMEAVNMRVLNELADSSGGRAFLISETFVGGATSQMEKALTDIATELRSQYTLGYYPGGAGNDQYHNIRVSVSRSNTSVRARRGYRASAR